MNNLLAWLNAHQAKIYMVIIGLAGIAQSLGWINATDANVVYAVFGAGTGLSVHQMFLNGLNALNTPSTLTATSSSVPVTQS